MSSFFTIPASQRKRKRPDSYSKSASAKQNTGKDADLKLRRKRARSESISEDGYGSDASRSSQVSIGSDVSSTEGETAAERRLRLAERYLANIREEVDETGFDAAEIDRDLIAERLKEDVAEHKGKQYRFIANSYDFARAKHRSLHADQLSFTGVVAHAPYIYAVSKDISVSKWEIPQLLPAKEPDQESSSDQQDKVTMMPKFTPRTRLSRVGMCRGRRAKHGQKNYLGHTGEILCVAVSPSGKYLATGGADHKLIIWTTEPLKAVKVFSQHRGAVTSLAFRRGTGQLFSSSSDRTVKTWSIDEQGFAYVETLFGHQDEVVGVDALADETCVTVGARDRTVRFWKVIEESQLVFRGAGEGSLKKAKKAKEKEKPTNGTRNGAEKSETMQFSEQSMDCVAFISSTHFVTGANNGAISLYTIHKKKPVFTVSLAHDTDPPPDLEQSFAEQHPEGKTPPVGPSPRWITALKAIPYSDLVLSASWDGQIRAWRVSAGEGSITEIGTLGTITSQLARGEVDGHSCVRGVVNDLAIFEKGERGLDGLCIAAAIGKEHRLGRWRRWKGKNTVTVFDVQLKTELKDGNDSGLSENLGQDR